MKGRKIRSYIILSILFLLTIAFVLDELGTFDSLLTKYETRIIDEELEKQQPARIDTEKSTSTPMSNTYDTNTGASQSQPPSTIIPSDDLQNGTEVNILSEQSIVSIVQSEKNNAFDIDSSDIENMVREAVELAGGFGNIIKDGQVIVIKPNLVQIHSDITGKKFLKEANGITTDWRVTKAVVNLVRKYNPSGKVYVMEGSAGDRTKSAYEYLNYTHEYIPGVDEFIAIEDSSGDWHEFNSPDLVKVDLPNGLLHKQYYLNKVYKEADVLISLPSLKNNSGTVVTGGIKNVAIGSTPANIYGLSDKSLSRTKMVSHSFTKGDLHKWIHDYYICKPVNFVIIDGLQGFQNGPVPSKKDSEEKDIMNMRLILAGKDPVAVDTIEALITGWDPMSAKYLRYLNASSMGNIDTTRITVMGKPVDEVRKFFKTKFKNSGGIEIKDGEPPSIKLEGITQMGDNLNLVLSTAEDTIKTEIFIDGKLNTVTFSKYRETLDVDIGRLEQGSHEVRLMAYDRFLNHAEINASFIKQ